MYVCMHVVNYAIMKLGRHFVTCNVLVLHRNHSIGIYSIYILQYFLICDELAVVNT